MNFHKTIGFLAALLLTLGIGVPDSFAQTAKVTSVSPFRVSEGTPRTVRVTVTLSEAPGADNTVSIALADNSAGEDGVTLTVVHDVDGTETPGYQPIVISGTNTTGTSTSTVTVTDDSDYYHPQDKDITITPTVTTVGGSPPTYTLGTDGAGTLVIRDDDTPEGSLTLSADRLGLSLNGNGDVIFTVGVPANIPAAQTGGLDVTVAWTDVSGAVGAGATGNIAAGSKQVVLTAAAVLTDTEGSVTATVSAVGYESAMVTISIINRNAADIEGFRVTIESHNDGEWVGFGTKKVKVQVKRLDTAYPWTAFESVVVALRDTITLDSGSPAGGGDQNIYTLTAMNFAEDNAENILLSMGTPTGTGLTTNNAGAHTGVQVAYSKANDALVFQFELVAITDADGSTAGTDDEALTALGNVATTTPAHPRAGDTNKGQRLAVYATATFSPGSMIRSNDTKGKVFSSPSALADVPDADKTVGDGKLIKIDLLAPTNIATGQLTVKKGDDALTENAELKGGDAITIEVDVDTQLRFRDDGVQIRVETLEVDAEVAGTVIGKAGTVLLTEDFTQRQVNDAGRSGNPLSASLSLTNGLIKVKAKAKSKTRDGANINANALFEPDNVTIQVLAGTIDQAGNFSGDETFDLVADTRKPVIDVLYPAAAGYFSGDVPPSGNFDEFLRPLTIRVDEPVQKMDVFVHTKHKINLWSGGNRVEEKVGTVKDAVKSVGDTISYSTMGLKTNAAGAASKNPGGTKVALKIEVTDKVGNKTTKTLSNVTHDEHAPILDNDDTNAKTGGFYPNSALLVNDDNQINNTTRHPIITLPEAVDSIAVIYNPSVGDNIEETVSGVTPKGDIQVTITEAFVQDRTYDLSIFVRDRAGNASMTDVALADDMKFNAQFENPMASAFTVTNNTEDESEGVIAGQAFMLEIQAIDNGGTPDDDADDRDAVTYKNDMASKVLISAWDMMSGGQAGSVRFSGGGVTDNGDGSATLDANGWSLGNRDVEVKSEMAIGTTKILIQHLDAAGDEAFNGSIEDLYVDAADFAKFNVTAMQNGIAVTELNPGAFDLEIVPADKYGNASTKAFAADPSSPADSLALLDSEVAKNTATNVEFDTIPVDINTIPTYEDLSLGWSFTVDGEVFSLDAPADRSRVVVHLSIEDDDLEPANARTAAIRTQREMFSIVRPLMPVLSLVDAEGNDVAVPVTVPADVTVKVGDEQDDGTVAGFEAGTMVAFTQNGTAMDAEAVDEDGFARLDISMSEAGDVMVSAMVDGRYDSEVLTIEFTATPPEPMRIAFTTEPNDAGDAVYLITRG